MLRTRRRDSEHGAVAVVVACLAMALFGMAAMAVDLGNAFARQRDVQAQADFAALSAALDLPGEAAVDDPAVVAVTEYLNRNQPQDDAGDACVVTGTCVAAAELVDGSEANGEVTFSDAGHRIRVVAPASRVDFGLAEALGFSSVDVAAAATALLGSPKGNVVFPMYVANPTPGQPGCDYGLQTLTDPPGGHVVPPAVPPLTHDADTNNNKLTDIDVFDGGLSATSIGAGSTTGEVVLRGDFKDATRVGFFRGDGSSSAPVEVARGSEGWPGEGPFTQRNGSVTVKVPSGVTAVDELWFVRVFQGGTSNKWSARAEAQPLSIGDAPYECVGGSTNGNFGTLKLPRSTHDSATDDGWIARTIALGLEAPMSLGIFPTVPIPWTCHSGMAEAVISTASDRRPSTNCLDTDTGMTHSTATPGFITGRSGSGAYQGLLEADGSSEDPDGSGGCSPSGDTSTVTLIGTRLNNDLLTCFLTDETTDLGTVARRSYSGGPKFHPEIYESPRFAWVPVFAQETGSGGSDMYSIVDFRPAFLTDQPMSATKANRLVGTSTSNGLGVSGSKLETIKMVFLNPNALPDGSATTPIGPYLGVGPKLLRLVD